MVRPLRAGARTARVRKPPLTVRDRLRRVDLLIRNGLEALDPGSDWRLRRRVARQRLEGEVLRDDVRTYLRYTLPDRPPGYQRLLTRAYWALRRRAVRTVHALPGRR